ncbi:MAG: hypothetical protein NWF04_07785 [Candidatus Bathyarchaeota archaeon]|nr:hypothetical protein [Candidatus Bathyarchaeota archaeon]
MKKTVQATAIIAAAACIFVIAGYGLQQSTAQPEIVQTENYWVETERGNLFLHTNITVTNKGATGWITIYAEYHSNIRGDLRLGKALYLPSGENYTIHFSNDRLDKYASFTQAYAVAGKKTDFTV